MTSMSRRVTRLRYLVDPAKIAAHIRHDTGRPCSIEQVEKLLKASPEVQPNGRKLGVGSRYYSDAPISMGSNQRAAVQGSRALLVAIAKSRLKAKRLPRGDRAHWQHVIKMRGAI